ncbi:GNAT family N-acetyltransferase [Patescibacteria group bacterium]
MKMNLKKDNKEKYSNFVKELSHSSIFQKRWWLDAVCGPNNWDVVLAEKGGVVHGALPYYFKHTMFGKLLTIPTLTQSLGPLIKYPNKQKYSTKLSYEKEIYNNLIDKLPHFSDFRHNFHHSIINWLPFYWRGFKQTTRYTYVINTDKNLADVWKNLDKKTRSEIKKAKKDKITLKDGDNINTFYKFNKNSFDRKNNKIPYSLELFINLNKEIKSNNSGKSIFALDSNNNIHAVIYFVWDESEFYYLAGGFDQKYKNSGAMSLLVWAGIEESLKREKMFNFEGSMIENVEKFFRGFGAEQKTYFQISKTNSFFLKTKNYLKSLL